MKNIFKIIQGKWKAYRNGKAKKVHKIKYNEKSMALLIDEFNLIQEKNSSLSKSERDKVEDAVSELVRSGKIQITIPK